MTERLYYEDSYLREFSATVLEEARHQGRPAVLLDRTAFYPTSGGQPHDTGSLNGSRVVEVLEDEHGRILHVLDSPLATLGPVRGIVDWERRFDHMQQHTGQHILSQAFVQAANAPTLSFHMGRENSTIDIALARPTPGLMAEVESLASGIVFENRPVRLLTVTPEELAGIGARKETERVGPIRIIDVEDFDRSPCGGTHVRGTGEIGMISVLGHENYKGGTRVTFVCGERARQSLRRDHELLRQISRLFSSAPDEAPRLIERLMQDRSARTKECERLQQELVSWEARALLHEADRRTGWILVRREYGEKSPELLKLLARKLTQEEEHAVAILAAVQGTALIVAARGSKAPGHCGSAVKETIARHGGRGGGTAEIAQAGGIPAGDLGSWLDALERQFAAVENSSGE